LLDDPLTPLDPSGQVEMTELLGELQAMGKTLVIATNRLEDVRRLCGSDSHTENLIGVLDDGQFTVFNTFGKLQQELREGGSTESSGANWLNELFAQA
jgi:ABC-type multidrug transport system ATPase subunit